MTDEDILNALQDINNILDGYLERVAVLKFNNPQKPEYYEQLLKAIKKVDRCVGGTVLPVEGECCADPEIPTISCEGATTDIYFEDFRGNWNIEIDGVLHETRGDSVGYYISENLAGILESVYAGQFVLFLVNAKSQNLRIKLIPLSDDTYTYVPTENNPTLLEHEDGSLTFCLAPRPLVEV